MLGWIRIHDSLAIKYGVFPEKKKNFFCLNQTVAKLNLFGMFRVY